MDEISAALKRLGFLRLQGQLFGTCTGQVSHVVWLKRDKLLGGTQVCVFVHHTGIADGAPWYISPVTGELSPRGVVDSFTWTADTPAADVGQLLSAFFSAFGASADIVNCLEGLYVPPQFEAAIDQLKSGQGPLAAPADCGGKPLYEITGGALSAQAAQTLLGAAFAPLARQLGLSVSKQSPLLAVRERMPGVFDCVRVLPDKYSTVFTVQVFNWVREIWAVEKRFFGEFHPFNARWVTDGGSTRWTPTRGVSEAVLAEWLGPIGEALSQVSKVSNCAEFMATMDNGYSAIRDRLSRYGARERR